MRITVEGSSRITVPAERAQVDFHVDSRGNSHEDVVAGVKAAAEHVREVLGELMSEGDRLQLSRLRTWTDVHTRDQPPHVAMISGKVTVSEVAELGKVLDALARVEGATITDVKWQLTQETREALAPRAIREAFEDACQRARWIAEAAGWREPEVVAVHDGNADGVGPRPVQMRGGTGVNLDGEDVEIAAALVVELESGAPPTQGTAAGTPG